MYFINAMGNLGWDKWHSITVEKSGNTEERKK